MSPDIHWQIGEDNDQETIAQVSTPRPTRRGWIVLMLVVIIGAGLGVVYRSIPEPVPLTAPAPSPTPPSTTSAIPAKLYQVIDREARALAVGDRRTLRELWIFPNLAEQQRRLEQVSAWGTVTKRPLYHILNFGLLSKDSAWAEVSQYRNGSNFRETRFYHLLNGQWRRAEVDRDFWSGQEQTADTVHFHVIYAVEDRELVTRILTQLEQDYDQICADYECPTSPRQCVDSLGQQWCSVYAREYTLTLQLGISTNPAFHDQILELPSPRVLGIYESDQPIRYDAETMAMALVPFSQIWSLAYAEPVFSSIPSPLVDQPLVIALTLRELEQLQIRHGGPAPRWDALLLDGQSDATGSPDLEALWTESASQQKSAVRMLDAYRFIEFLEQEFGKAALVKLLHNMQEPSASKAFEASTGIPFNEVQQRWAAWLKSHRP